MPLDPRIVYRDHPEDYHRLVMAEDCDDRLMPAIESLYPLSNARVLEVGAGTGRLTRSMLQRGARVEAFEKEPSMLDVAADYLGEIDETRYALETADARQLPTDEDWADLAVAGWVFGHFRYWMQDDWQRQVDTALAEMDRALAEGGVGVVIETLGTGHTEPNPPPGLVDYFEWLETDYGCSRQTIRTDYQFDTVEQATDTLGMFFGTELAERVRIERWTRVPEVTGIWWWEK